MSSKDPSTCDTASPSTLTAAISSDLPASQMQRLLALLNKHGNSFDAHLSTLGQSKAAAHRIQTDEASIVRRRPYRVFLAERKITEENVADMLQRALS